MSNIHTQLAIANQKSTGIVFLLWAFLGFFGAHRFYTTGVTMFNIIYLLTFGFFYIGTLIDVFLIWDMAAKANNEAMMHAIIMDREARWSDQQDASVTAPETERDLKS